MLYLIVALPAEARPLAGHYKLRDKSASGPFSVFRNDTMALAVSGIGKLAAAAATAYLHGRLHRDGPAAWLNIGIAGHASRTLGDGVIAHRITDHASGQNWYPPQVLGLGIVTDNLLTVDSPQLDYRDGLMYDMEASGFYQTACRCTTAELVQCFKVISDNRDQPATAVTANDCADLISSCLDRIDRVVDMLQSCAQQLAAAHAPSPELEQLTRHWHFTASQTHRLTELVRRWKTLAPDQPVWCSELKAQQRAGEVLLWMEQRLHTLPVKLC
jgi:nucleoside phosphorylase